MTNTLLLRTVPHMIVDSETSGLNATALAVADRCASHSRLGVESAIVGGARVLDFGVKASGGLQAGIELAQICLAGLGTVEISPGRLDGRTWPQVVVRTDRPVEACLLSQYAGWQIAVEKYFAMGSGPMRAVAGREALFEELQFHEDAPQVVGVLEAGQLPDESVIAWIADRLKIAPEQLTLCVARTASLAGTLQIVARSIETALHKLHELKFDVRRVRSGFGAAPLPPVASEDLTGIGRTNDAILYGGSVSLWVTGDDASIAEIGPQVPSSSSPVAGRPFLELFHEAGGDFYKIDPLLFSPAEVNFCNLETGRQHSFGHTQTDVMRTSFGLEFPSTAANAPGLSKSQSL